MKFLRRARAIIDSNSKVIFGLTQIKGVDMRLAQAIVKTAELNPNLRIGDLSEEQLARIDNIISNPIENGIPNWMVNRLKDLHTGEDHHIITNKLEIIKRRDIDRMKKIKSFKGKRHPRRLKVRGRSIYSEIVSKIHSLMKTRGSNEIVLERKYLPEFIGKNFLDFKNGYIIKERIVKYLEENNIEIQYKDNFIKIISNLV
ncbi:MAG: 30S ribosomal protein S13 [Candidatus Hermodarchaeota archaeon]